MAGDQSEFAFWIDSHTGRVRLPCGFELVAGLRQTQLRESEIGKAARAFDCGTLPFMHYDIDPGTLEGARMLGRLTFYAETLLGLSVLVTFARPGATWDDYSLELEAKAKQYHDAYLARLFGPPQKVHRLGSQPADSPEAVLDTSNEYSFPWGRVISCHDTRGGDTSIVIQYGDRHARANAAYTRGVRQIEP